MWSEVSNIPNFVVSIKQSIINPFQQSNSICISFIQSNINIVEPVFVWSAIILA
jgi:hypothetical protein